VARPSRGIALWRVASSDMVVGTHTTPVHRRSQGHRRFELAARLHRIGHPWRFARRPVGAWVKYCSDSRHSTEPIAESHSGGCRPRLMGSTCVLGEVGSWRSPLLVGRLITTKQSSYVATRRTGLGKRIRALTSRCRRTVNDKVLTSMRQRAAAELGR
jgi:hypothetical protein